ncbi:hypothetical protein IAT40_001034 [Kwoniella sp. CBS 6097]
MAASPPSLSHQAATASANPSSSSRQAAPLTSTLSKLSQSTSGPSIPSGLNETSGIAGQTMKLGREALRRSGLASLWRTESDMDGPIKRSNDEGSSRRSLESTSSTASFNAKLRSQPLDTSSILYPTLTIHPAPVSHNILVLSISHISSAPPTLTNDELFNIVLRRLEPWVGEEGEGGYVLVIMADEYGGDQHVAGKGKAKEMRKLPGYAWWVWRWKRLPRKYRKNLKRLYIVHPSLFTRTLLPFIIPFISPKSYPKLHPLPSLLSLYHTYGVSLESIDLSLSVLEAEAKLLRERPEMLPPLHGRASSTLNVRPKLASAESDSSLASWSYHAFSSAVNIAFSYLPVAHLGISGPVDPVNSEGLTEARGYWGRDLQQVLDESRGDVPRLLKDLQNVILAECTTTEGVFRRSSNSPLFTPLVALLDLPIGEQPNIPWTEIARHDPLLPPKILSKFMAELRAPVIKPDDYAVISRIKSAEDINNILLPSLPPSSITLLSFLAHTLHQLSLHSSTTRMTALTLSIVISPVLISGPDPIEDTIMCLEPDKPLPAGLKEMAKTKGLTEGGGTLVGLLDIWIKNWPSVSSRSAELEIGKDPGLEGGDARHALLMGQEKEVTGRLPSKSGSILSSTAAAMP